MSRHHVDPDADDARADDFRCLSCETPLALPNGQRRLCAACELERTGYDEA